MVIKMKKPLIIEIHQTTSACPTQFEGKTSDGRMVYIRYRFGRLSLQISKKPADFVDRLFEDFNTYYDEIIGERYDGCIDLDLLKEKLKDVVMFRD